MKSKGIRAKQTLTNCYIYNINPPLVFSTLRKDAHAKFYFSTTFGLSFMISSVAPIPSLTFYTFLITKIGNRYLKVMGDSLLIHAFAYIIRRCLFG